MSVPVIATGPMRRLQRPWIPGPHCPSGEPDPRRTEHRGGIDLQAPDRSAVSQIGWGPRGPADRCGLECSPGRQCAVDLEVRGLSDQRRLAPLDRCTSVSAPPSTRGFPSAAKSPRLRESRHPATPLHADQQSGPAIPTPSTRSVAPVPRTIRSRTAPAAAPSTSLHSLRGHDARRPRSGSVLSWSVRPAGRMACVVRM
jgi:hypothetical protein